MATGEDRPSSLDDDQPSGQHHRRGLALFVVLGLLAAGGIGAAVALAVSGGNDEAVKSVEASAGVITTTTTPGTSITTAATTQTTTARSGGTAAPKGGTAAPKGGTTAPKGGTTAPKGGTAAPKGGTTAPATDAPAQAPAGGATNQSAPSTTTPPPATEGSTATTPGSSPTDFGVPVAPPEFTEASASPPSVPCQPGNTPPPVNVNFSATNAENVTAPAPGLISRSAGPYLVDGAFSVSDPCATNSLTLTATGPGGTTSTTVVWIQVRTAV